MYLHAQMGSTCSALSVSAGFQAWRHLNTTLDPVVSATLSGLHRHLGGEAKLLASKRSGVGPSARLPDGRTKPRSRTTNFNKRYRLGVERRLARDRTRSGRNPVTNFPAQHPDLQPGDVLEPGS